MPIKIITDSGSDIPLEYVNQYDITVVQLPVHFGHELMPEDTDTKAFMLKCANRRICRPQQVPVRKSYG